MRLNFFIISLIFIVGCKNTAEEKEPIRPVFIKEVTKSIASENLTFPGVTQAAQNARLSFKVSGKIENVLVKMGDTLKAGDKITYLDASEYLINYNKAKATLKNAEMQLIMNKSTFSRIENLYINNNISLSEYEKARIQLQYAETNESTALAQFTAAENQLLYTSLYAPFDGIVTSVMIKENEMIGVGVPVVIVSSVGNLEVVTSVPENIISHINYGDIVILNFKTLPDKHFTGVVSEISPGIQNVSAYPVVVRLNEVSTQLIPGMTCSVTFEVQRQVVKKNYDSFFVPLDAVGKDHTGYYVFIAVRTDSENIYTAVKKNVKVGGLSLEGYEVIEGLEEGNMVITAGLSFLFSGREVKLIQN